MLISRYIFRQTASALILILVSLTMIVWLTSLLRNIQILTSQGQTFFLFIEITALQIPNLLIIVAPFAFLIATLHIMNRLSGDSELIVLSAAGASVWRVLTPYLTLAILVSISLLIATNFILPPATRLSNDLISEIHGDILSQILQPGEFTELEKGLTFHIRDKTDDGEMLGVIIHDERVHEDNGGKDGKDPKEITTIIADRGEVLSDGIRSVMNLKDGQIIRQTPGKVQSRIVNYQTYTFDLADFSESKGKRDLKARERPTSALIWPDETEVFYIENKSKFRSEIHERFAAPLYPLIFTFISLMYLGRPRTTRQGRSNMLIAAFTVSTLVRVLGIPGVNIAGKKLWGLALVYGIPVGGILIILYMLAYDLEPSLSLPSFRRKAIASS